MTGWLGLPTELVIQILYFCDARTVLGIKLLDRFHLRLVQDSSRLQYLIELGRDCLIPVHYRTTHTAVSLLEAHLQRRNKWKNFILRNPDRSPPKDSEFHIYEFCGGSLAHCSPGAQDDICFQRLCTPASIHSSDTSQMTRVSLSFKCAEFSFDPVQDVLIVLQDCGPNFPVHVLSATTGLPHPRAAKHIFEDLVRTTSTIIDVETCIANETVSLAYFLREADGFSPISVINWVTGDVLLRLNATASRSATLLSPRYLMTIRCGSKVTLPGPGIDIYDLDHPNHPYVEGSNSLHAYTYPVLTLLLPYLSPTSSHAFHSSWYNHGSNNAAFTDRGSGTIRTEEADVISALIQFTRPQHNDPPYRLILFISRKRLLQLAIERLSTFNMDLEHPDGLRKEKASLRWNIPPGYHPTKSFKLWPIEIRYNIWTEGGRYTRWLDGTNVRLVSKCAMYGSRFACTTNPEDIGVTGYNSVDGLFGHVCILEFNERLFKPPEEQRGVVRVIDNKLNSALTVHLGVDARGGLPFRVSWFKKPSSKQWADVMLDENHLVARLMDGFDIFTI